MKNFFYDELNSLANINANTDEADDQVIISNFETPANIIGSLDEEEQFIYGKLNKEVEFTEYKGLKTRTANVIVDNANLTIAVDIDFKGLDSGCATDEELQKVKQKLADSIITTNNLLEQEKQERITEDNKLNTKIDKEILDRQNAIVELKNTIDNEITTNINSIQTKLDQEVEDRKQAITDLKTTIDEEVKTNLDELRTEINENIKVDIEALQENLAEETQARKEQIETLENTINNEIKNSLDIMQEKLYDEVENRTEAINQLENTINNNILTKLDTQVIEDITLSQENDLVSITNRYINLSSKEQTTSSKAIELASDTQAGIMSMADYKSLRDLESRVGHLEGKTSRILYTEKQNPTAEEINAFVLSLPQNYQIPFEGVSVVIDETYHIWRYYENINNWKDDGADTVHQFTNEIAGTIKGIESDGKVYAETDGTGSVYGWDELKLRVSTNESKILDNYNNLPRVYRLTEV